MHLLITNFLGMAAKVFRWMPDKLIEPAITCRFRGKSGKHFPKTTSPDSQNFLMGLREAQGHGTIEPVPKPK